MEHHLQELNSQIDSAMGRDRFRLRRRLQSIEQAERRKKPFDRNLARLKRDLQQSIQLRQSRVDRVPRVELDPELPITGMVQQIRDAVDQNPVTIVCGETGSGKSTQLPKICLQLGRGVDGMIGHTQPRRLAARSIATRLADELGTRLGGLVGFKIRFTDTTEAETYIKLMTDGILLAETQNDRYLNQYDTIIIDEAHERSLNIDFLLGYIKSLLTRRADLKLIITSATIDAERFAEHFADRRTGRPAPIIEVSGRTYPVELRYRPPETVEEDGTEPDLQQQIVQAVGELARIDRGDMLIFLPTERDIRETAKSLRGSSIASPGQRTEILPLYARLSNKDQQRVFQPHKQRRIVLATNVAESSLTVPGVRYVIDTGTARISRYSPRRKVQRLPIEAVSRASADQRAGRCGRVAPGVCIRLFSEEDYLSRDQYATPEIRRTNLASVILRTKALRLGAIEDYPFLDPPKPEAIRDGYKTLFELGAIDRRQELTDVGRKLARLPVDPRIGRMILAAVDEQCLHEVLIIAAALEVQDPRERPVEKQQAADLCHARFADQSSDFLSFLALWDFYHNLRSQLSRNQLRRACQKNFLSFNRMREWLDIHRQLKQLISDAGLQRTPARPSSEADVEKRYAAIHRALLTGLLSNIALRGDAHQYLGCGGAKFYLWPGSGVFKEKPQWIMAAELVETTRNYMRTVARIAPAWIEPLAGHLCKRTYSEAHWSRRTGSAMAYEKVTLVGLPIVQRRRVRFGPIEPETSRELLIRCGLVEGQLKTNAGFFRHNQALLAEIEASATKTRRTDLFVGEEQLVEFYEARVPREVYDAARLNNWLSKIKRNQPRALYMTPEDLIDDAEVEETNEHFPAKLDIGPASLPLEYRFEPGNDDDGITVTVPQAALSQLDDGRLGWLVPGLLEQKVLGLIRSLPKSIRRNFVPTPETAKRVVQQIRFGEGPFLQAVADTLRRVSGEHVSPRDFQLDRLPQHLHMNVRVVDEQGQELSSARNLERLQQDLGGAVTGDAPLVQDSDWHRDGITTWDFGELPESVVVPCGGIPLTLYPTLVERDDDVALRLADSSEQAAQQTRGALRRLCCLAMGRELRSQVTWLPRLDQLKLYAATLCGPKLLEQQLAELIADRAFLDRDVVPRDPGEFNELVERGKRRMGVAVDEVARFARPLLESYHQARLGLEGATSPNWQYAVEDMWEQLHQLAPADFLAKTPWTWLQHCPRYLRGIDVRLKKLASSGWQRDGRSYEQIRPHLVAYRQRFAEHQERGVTDIQLQHFRWMLEEFRISLFAQELRTSIPVSTKRLERQWAKVQ